MGGFGSGTGMETVANTGDVLSTSGRRSSRYHWVSLSFGIGRETF
jgi:hypothetical protein